MAGASSTTADATQGGRHSARAASGQGGFLAALTVLMMLVFAFLYFQAYQAESLDDVDGYNAPAGTTVRNLKSLLAVGLSSGKNLTVTEKEINAYLSATLHARQAGPLASKASISGVAVRLVDGQFQLIIARQLFGRPHTVAMNFDLSQIKEGNASVWQVQADGGRIGRLPVNGGLLRLILKPVGQIGSAYAGELKILRHASSVRVEDGRILLGPVEVKK